MKNKILLNQNDTVFFLTNFLEKNKKFPLGESYNLWNEEQKRQYVKRMCGGVRTEQQNQKLYQMLLLHDEIIFPYGILDNVDLAAISKYFKSTVLDSLDVVKEYNLNYYQNVEMTRKEDELFVEYMKPAIMDVLVIDLCPKYYIKKGILSNEEFISYMIDCAFEKDKNFEHINNTVYSNLKENVELFVAKAYKPYYVDAPRNPTEKLDCYLREFYQDIFDVFYRALWEVKQSNDNDCLLYNSYYEVNYLGVQKRSYNVTTEEEIYKNIRININDKIRQLPKMMSFDELLRIKDKHKKDIKRLRQVIDEFEQRILLEGNTNIIQHIDQDIEKAIKELNKSEIVSKVSSMATYASLPISIAETVLSIFPVIGLTTGVVGVATTATTSYFKKQNNWINIVR